MTTPSPSAEERARQWLIDESEMGAGEAIDDRTENLLPSLTEAIRQAEQAMIERAAKICDRKAEKHRGNQASWADTRLPDGKIAMFFEKAANDIRALANEKGERDGN